MSEKYKIHSKDFSYFVTLTVSGWKKIFLIKGIRDIVINSILFCQEEKGLELYGYVIMPDHIHLILKSEKMPVSLILRDLKKFTSRKIIHHLKQNDFSYLLKFFSECTNISRVKHYKIWIDGNRPIMLYRPEMFYQKLNYIHNNPVKAGISENAIDYCYSSAWNYAGLGGVIEIIFVTPELKTIK